MNFVRRRPGNNSIREQTNEQTLECSHLSKLYGQCRQIQDSSEQEQMFYELLPIFHGVLSNCKPFELMEKFPDVHSFCSRATQMLVKEINLRAANHTSEEGSYRVFQYLEPSLPTHCLISLEEEPVPSPLNVENRGWNLLSCLNLLSSGHVNLIECIVAAYLPSTLVKCLYIFLDLPGDTQSNPPIFHHTFKQILQRLSLYPSSAEELARKDALCLLFRATCERCRPPNAIWRSTAACILSTVAQNGLTLSVVKYIHETKCIQEVLRISSDGLLAPIELFDSFVALLHVLRESTAVSHVLLDDFRHANGYTAITELILKLEQNPDHLVETKSALRTLISLTERLVTCGAVELRPKAGAGEQIHVIPGFRVPMPKTGMRKSVRNVLAFDVLQSTFLSASSTDLCLLLLDAIKSIYLQDLANYFILEPQCTLALFAKKIYHTSAEVQKAYFDLLDTLVTTLRYVPMKEISSIVVLLKTLDFSSCAALTLHHFIHLLNEYRVFRDVYHDIGLLELAVDFLQRFTDLLDQWKTSGTDEHEPAVTSAFEVGLLLMDLIRQCVTSSGPNTDMCLRLNLADCLVNRLLPINMTTNAIGKCRRQALNIMEELMLTNGGDELMPLLLTQMHVAVVELKIEILRSFCRVLRESHRCRVVFRKVNGFVYVMQEMVYLEDCLTFAPAGTKGGQFESGTASVTSFDHSAPDQHNGQQFTTRSQFLASLTYEQIFSLVRIIFSTLGIAMKFEPASAHYFATEIQYSNLTHTVIALGSFTPRCTTQSTSIEEHNASMETASVVHNGVDTDTPDLVGSDVFQFLFRSVKKAEAALFGCVSTTGKAASSEVTVQPPASPSQPVGVPRHLIECCVLARYVYNLAIDAYDRRPSRLTATVPDKRPEDDTLSVGAESSQSALLKQTNADGSAPCPPRIVHSGAVISLLHLTAAVNRDSTRTIHQCAGNERFDWTVSLQDCLLDVIGELLQSERNQQVMCSVAMPRELLHLFEAQLASDTSPLHNRVLSLFECLVAQGLSPNDLRQYLRINNPLCCPVSEFTQPPVDTHMDPLDEINLAWTRAKLRSGGPLPLSQVKCLIATATPVCAVVARPTASSASSLSGTSAHTTETSFYESTQQTRTNPPPFVEFDMGPEGFGCLFLPSIAPQGPASVANLSGAASIPESEILTGGVGTGDSVIFCTLKSAPVSLTSLFSQTAYHDGLLWFVKCLSFCLKRCLCLADAPQNFIYTLKSLSQQFL
ncbi:unnamed protein product [Dicrocoelium dendriticum]|nr:unnamed protein product [Dicrocoelium dendriticum]